MASWAPALAGKASGLAGWTSGLAGPQAWLAGAQAWLDGPEGGMDERTNKQTDGRKISPFYRNSSPIGAAALKGVVFTDGQTMGGTNGLAKTVHLTKDYGVTNI